MAIIFTLIAFIYWTQFHVSKKYYPIEVSIAADGNRYQMDADSIVEKPVCDCHTSDSTTIKTAYKDGLKIELGNIVYIKFKQ